MNFIQSPFPLAQWQLEVYRIAHEKAVAEIEAAKRPVYDLAKRYRQWHAESKYSIFSNWN